MLSTSGFELKSCIQRILRLDEIIPALLCLPLASNSASAYARMWAMQGRAIIALGRRSSSC